VIVLRPATEADLPAMAAVFIAAWRGGYRGIVPDEIIDALDPADVAAELAANPHERSTTVAVAVAVDGNGGGGDGDGDGGGDGNGDGNGGGGDGDGDGDGGDGDGDGNGDGNGGGGDGNGNGDGRIVAFVCFGDDDAGDGGYLASLYVDPVAARAGLGARLLEHALDSMPGLEVTLWVFAANHAARRLYERAGFRLDGAELTDPRWATPQVRYRRPTPP
jgi:ribosomal protein S18 acetylase RimI-like enzyme